MLVLKNNEITESQPVLLDVFRDGYGDRYVGDDRFLRGYLQPAHIALLDERDGKLHSAALLRNSRITAVATRTDREKYGSRFQSLVGLLQSARILDPKAWIGIGVTAKETIKIGASTAGMSQSTDEDLLRTRLERSGKIDQYTIRPTSAGLLIKLASSNNGMEYWQEMGLERARFSRRCCRRIQEHIK